MPDAFSTPQFAITVDGQGKLGSERNLFRLFSGKTFTQGLQGMVKAALGGDGMDDRNHNAIINPQTCGEPWGVGDNRLITKKQD
jgi:hypothetical protein